VLELRNKLMVRKFDEDAINNVLAELVGAGYLSDKRFAELFVRGRFERGVGPLRIQAELRQRGIPDDLMANPLEEFSASWIESASQLRAKRFGDVPPADFHSRAKQMRFLQQRGFTGEQIRAVFQH
jgi:regulatory protein